MCLAHFDKSLGTRVRGFLDKWNPVSLFQSVVLCTHLHTNRQHRNIHAYEDCFIGGNQKPEQLH